MSILSSLLNLGQPQPTQMIPETIQTTEIAKEVAPFIKDILGKGQALYKQRMDEGYVPYEGQTLAEMSPDQLAAEEGLRGLVGSQAANIAEARGLTRGQIDAPTVANLQPFMNPYQQAVTDIAKRQATEQFQQTTLPTLRKQAVDAGSFGGSRAAMLESQAQDNQARLLADLQAKGDLAAFQNAQKAFADQKERERLAAEGLTSLSGIEDTAARRELAGLQAVGVTQQQREQQLLDEAYKKFLDERKFPESQLAQYQGFVKGASPFLGPTSTTMTPQTYEESPIERALTFGTSAIGTGLKAKKLFSKEGGGIEQGLASLPIIRRQKNNQVLSKEEMLRKVIEEVSPMTGVSDTGTDEGSSNMQSVSDLLNSLQDINVGGKNLASKGPPLDEFVSELPERIIGGLSKIVSPTERQNQRAVERDAQITRMKSNKDFAESGRPGLDEFKELQKEYETKQQESQLPPGVTADGEFDGDATGELGVPGTNITIPLSGPYPDQTTLDDTIASQVPFDKPKSKQELKDNLSTIPSEQDALTALSTNLTNLQTSINERKDARLANIKASKAALKAQAQIDFLMGFGRGKRDSKDGSFLGGLTSMGQSAVDATKDYNKEIMALDKEELDVLDKNVEDLFNLETQRINLAFKNGEIDREHRDYLLEEKKVAILELKAGNDKALESFNLALSIMSDINTQPATKQQLLKKALDNKFISLEHYNMALTNPDKLLKNNSSGYEKKVPITKNR